MEVPVTTKQRREPPEELTPARDDSRHVLIGEQVIDALGEPAGLLRVQVRHLWDSRYRVNVFVGPDVVSARVANSYFLTVDDEGTIVTSAPRMKREYERPAKRPADNSSAADRG